MHDVVYWRENAGIAALFVGNTNRIAGTNNSADNAVHAFGFCTIRSPLVRICVARLKGTLVAEQSEAGFPVKVAVIAVVSAAASGHATQACGEAARYRAGEKDWLKHLQPAP
jgi:hypothetical protein